MVLKNNDYFKRLLFKINDDHFYNALKVTLCAIIIFIFFLRVNNFTLPLGMILGLSLSSLIDISSSLKDKIFGLIIASAIVPLVTLLLSYVYIHVYLFYLVFAILVFISSLISIYGLRATQFSFMLLLAICLSFLDISNTNNSISNSINMFYGGILYLIVSVLFYLIRPTKYIDIQLAICINHISEYLRLRSQLWDENPNVDAIEEKQLTMQVNINESFKKINQFLEINKRKIINSKHNRKVILASSFINEIMELALSTVFKSSDIKLYGNESNLKTSVKQITTDFAINLESLAESIKLRSSYKPPVNLVESFDGVQNTINKLKQIDTENDAYLENILNYLDNQIKKIRGLERVFTENILVSDISVNSQDLQKYFSPKQYPFKTLLENFSFKSIYFRYATRLTIAMIIGLLIGSLNQFKQEYWILSTIVLIMQPGYGLTKVRMNQRIIGTIIAGILGICILFFISKTLSLAILTIIAMLLSVWFSNPDYKSGVIFNTLYMILLYGILKSGVELNFLYRISDTLIGAFLAFLTTNYLWPSWETLSIKQNLITSINNTKCYINEFRNIYIQKNTDGLALQDSRQDAFIAIGNLMASYQRLVQEPKNKQQNRAQLYQIAIIIQSIIGAVASLGNFIRSNENDDSFKSYDKIFNTIIYNLDLGLNYFDSTIKKQTTLNICSSSGIVKMQIDQKNQIQKINISDSDQRSKLQESQLVLTQLSWIVNLSEQIVKTAQTIK